ncbi:MAG: Mur ligase family protein [Candidatus Paceibacterota bacterium]
MHIFLKPFFSLYHYLWAFVSAVFFWFPSRKIRVIGITGTKGKTTTVALLAHIFSTVGKQSAYLSSARMSDGISTLKNKTGNSMPGRFFIQQFLYRAVRAKSLYAFIEVTSQGTVQHRHRFIQWAGAVFLDIHPEHIESHGSFEKYLSAKLLFFKYAYSRTVRFFIYKHDAHADDFIRVARDAKKILFSEEDLYDVPTCSSLPGNFNAINIAAAYAVAREEGLSHEQIVSAITSFSGVPGRMEFVVRDPFEVVVDYAHTPESVEAVYIFLQKRAHDRGGKLICVLGSAGGGRDIWKRPAMGKHAGDYGDEIVLTNEDPWDENPQTIIDAIHEGVKTGKQYNVNHVFIIMDRQEAITKALSLAHRGDLIVLTGKGSESWIHIADGKKIPWSESETVQKAMQEISKN